MIPGTLLEQAEALALSLENAVAHSTTRVEHIRVAGHAARARALANGLSQSPQAASKPPVQYPAASSAGKTS